MPKNPNRTAKVNSLIQETVAMSLPKYLEGMPSLVTVVRVETSGDMKWAKVFISVLGGSEEAVLDTIKKNIYDIQGDVNKMFTTKIIPRLQFSIDTTAAYAQHIDEVIREIHKIDGKAE